MKYIFIELYLLFNKFFRKTLIVKLIKVSRENISNFLAKLNRFITNLLLIPSLFLCRDAKRIQGFFLSLVRQLTKCGARGRLYQDIITAFFQAFFSSLASLSLHLNHINGHNVDITPPYIYSTCSTIFFFISIN